MILALKRVAKARVALNADLKGGETLENSRCYYNKLTFSFCLHSHVSTLRHRWKWLLGQLGKYFPFGVFVLIYKIRILPQNTLVFNEQNVFVIGFFELLWH